MIDRKRIGASNKRKGREFELKVKEDLEARGWIVTRCSLNYDLEECKLVQAKGNRFHGPTGFPDFIAFTPDPSGLYIVNFVECKVNGYLRPVEREKVKHLKTYVNEFIVASDDGFGGVSYESV